MLRRFSLPPPLSNKQRIFTSSPYLYILLLLYSILGIPHDLEHSTNMLVPCWYRLSFGGFGWGIFERVSTQSSPHPTPQQYLPTSFNCSHLLVGWRSGHRVSFTFVCLLAYLLVYGEGRGFDPHADHRFVGLWGCIASCSETRALQP